MARNRRRSAEILKNTIAECLIKLPGMTIDLPATVAPVDASYLGAAAITTRKRRRRLAAALAARHSEERYPSVAVWAMASGMTGNLSSHDSDRELSPARAVRPHASAYHPRDFLAGY
jgi:hypothetical protein